MKALLVLAGVVLAAHEETGARDGIWIDAVIVIMIVMMLVRAGHVHVVAVPTFRRRRRRMNRSREMRGFSSFLRPP